MIVTLLWLHTTMMSVTLYFHRDQAHRSVDLHPAVRHFCRFWLWMNTGASTREWVAVHRKHHAHCETGGRSAQPRLFGLKKVLLEGAELYRAEARNPETAREIREGPPRRLAREQRLPQSARQLFRHLADGSSPTSCCSACRASSCSRCSSRTCPLLAAGVINGLCHAQGLPQFRDR